MRQMVKIGKKYVKWKHANLGIARHSLLPRREREKGKEGECGRANRKERKVWWVKKWRDFWERDQQQRLTELLKSFNWEKEKKVRVNVGMRGWKEWSSCDSTSIESDSTLSPPPRANQRGCSLTWFTNFLLSSGRTDCLSYRLSRWVEEWRSHRGFSQGSFLFSLLAGSVGGKMHVDGNIMKTDCILWIRHTTAWMSEKWNSDSQLCSSLLLNSPENTFSKKSSITIKFTARQCCPWSWWKRGKNHSEVSIYSNISLKNFSQNQCWVPWPKRQTAAGRKKMQIHKHNLEQGTKRRL